MALTRRDVARELRELIAALDRRVPRAERARQAPLIRDCQRMTPHEEPRRTEPHSRVRDETWKTEIERRLKEMVVRVSDVSLCRYEEGRIENVQDATESVHAHSGDRKIADRGDGAVPQFESARYIHAQIRSEM